MNNQNRQSSARVGSAERATYTYGRRKRPNPEFLRLMRLGMLVSSAVILMLGLVLIILPMFRVSAIDVVNNTVYSDEQIIGAAQLAVDHELFALPDDEELRNRIFEWDTKRYITSIGIERRFGDIIITVTEAKNVMYTEQNGTFYVLDSNLKTMYATDDEASLSAYPKVTLPEGASFVPGKIVAFSYETPDTAYIGELLSELDARGCWGEITELDLSKKFSVSYVLENACRVKLGKVGDMNVKMNLVSQIMALKGVNYSTLSVVDVSNTEKPTYRALPMGEVLSNH
jgi:cell division septal protein FtsQ